VKYLGKMFGEDVFWGVSIVQNELLLLEEFVKSKPPSLNFTPLRLVAPCGWVVG